MRVFRVSLLALVFLAWGGELVIDGVNARGISGAGAPATHLYVILLPGLCGWSGAESSCHDPVPSRARAQATFSTFLQALRKARIPYRPLYYSFDPKQPSAYRVSDTHQALSRSVHALDGLVRRTRMSDPLARFDLVGFSLGGVIAARWVAGHRKASVTDPSGTSTSDLHSMVTFDSPLKGIRGGLTADLLSRVFGGPIWHDLQANAAGIRAITSLPNAWWSKGAHLHTVANRADLLVPASEATLGHQKVVDDRSCPRDLLWISSCHGAVLSDAALNAWVACHWVTDSRQCVPAPTPTPSPTVSPTVTPSATPTPTIAPSPTLTQTVPPPPL